jgi:hypothetical protein
MHQDGIAEFGPLDFPRVGERGGPLGERPTASRFAGANQVGLGINHSSKEHKFADQSGFLILILKPRKEKPR